MKLSKKEIANLIFDMTTDYTYLFMKAYKKDMDKQLWAALHIGFITGMKINGYEEKELMEALDIAHKQIKKL